MGRRGLMWVLSSAFVIGAVVTGLAVRDHQTYGTEFTEDDLTVEVSRGERFSLAVPDRGGSVGDSWSAATPTGLILVGEDLVLSSWEDRLFGPDPGGGRGTTYFTFTADKPGTVTVPVTNCFQGCKDPDDQAASRTVTWSVTVR